MASIKIKNSELLNLHKGIQQVEGSGKELDAKILYAITKTKRSIIPNIEDIEKTRKSIQDKHAEIDDKTKAPKLDKENRIVFKKDAEDKAAKEFDEILEKEIDIDVHKIPLSELNVAFNLQEVTVIGKDPKGEDVKAAKFTHIPYFFDYMIQNGEE